MIEFDLKGYFVRESLFFTGFFFPATTGPFPPRFGAFHVQTLNEMSKTNNSYLRFMILNWLECLQKKSRFWLRERDLAHHFCAVSSSFRLPLYFCDARAARVIKNTLKGITVPGFCIVAGYAETRDFGPWWQ